MNTMIKLFPRQIFCGHSFDTVYKIFTDPEYFANTYNSMGDVFYQENNLLHTLGLISGH